MLYTIQVFRGAYWNTTGKGGANWRRGTYWIQGANSNFYGTSILEATLKKTTHSSYTLHSSIHIQGCLGYTLVSVKIRDVLNGFPVFMSLGDLQIVLQSNFIPEFEHPRSQGLFPTPPPRGVGKRPWERGWNLSSTRQCCTTSELARTRFCMVTCPSIIQTL